MNIREAIEGFIVLFFAVIVGVYSRHNNLLLIITFITFIISMWTGSIDDFGRILQVACVCVLLGTIYMYIDMMRTSHGRKELIHYTKRIKRTIFP